MRKNKHFKDRVRERFGIRLTQKQMTEIMKGIENGNYEIDFKEGRRTTYKVIMKNKLIRVVYDQRTKRLVTALNPTYDMIGNLIRKRQEKYARHRKRNRIN